MGISKKLLHNFYSNRAENFKDDLDGAIEYNEFYQEKQEVLLKKHYDKFVAQEQEKLEPIRLSSVLLKSEVKIQVAEKLKAYDEKDIWRRKANTQTQVRGLAKATTEADKQKITEVYETQLRALNKRREEYDHKVTASISSKLQSVCAKDEKEQKENLAKYKLVLAESDKRCKAEHQKLEVQKQANIKAFQIKTDAKVSKASKKYETTLVDAKKYSASKVDQKLEKNVVLSLHNLTMQFGGLKAVDNLSFDVKKGEIFGLIGPNGAGKTTVFNCITQFYKPTKGEVYYEDKTGQVLLLNEAKVHNVIKKGIVRTFQNVELVWELTVLENLLVAAHSLFKSNLFDQFIHTPKLKKEEEMIRAKALKVLDYLGLTYLQNAYPVGLPYGILKKIELARTLMCNPRLIILDEPAAGLNDAETQELAVLIKKIRDEYKVTIFLVEHDMGLVMDICDTICAISFGKMLAIGTPKQIQKDPAVQEAYLGGE